MISLRAFTRFLPILVVAIIIVVMTGPGPAAAGREASNAPTGLHVVGQQLHDGANHPVILRGVNRSGSEYACIQGWGFFDGPSDLASVQAIAAWGANAVRIPLNEGCWLNINGAPPTYSGAAYHNAIAAYVANVQAAGLVPILELHWTGAGTAMANGQQPMLNRDHSRLFWQQVANAYKTNTGVLFDLHNEPYPDGNSDTVAAWDCWKNGTTATNGATCPGSGFTYQAAGMQELVDLVRATGATNPIMLGGVQYSNALSRWLTYKPQDSTGNLIAAWHVYNFNICSSVACYDATAAPVAAAVPLVAGEIGQNDCGSSMFTTLMNWLDSHNAGYLAWTWDTWGTACANLSLITDYNGTPTAYGQVYRDHLSQVSCAQVFSDVLPGSTFYEPIGCLTCRGIVSGYADGTFKPNNQVTRGQLAKIVSNAANFTENPNPQIFEDVPSSNTFYQWINRLARRGYMSGYPCGGAGEPCLNGGRPYFRPSANATRGQTSKIVSNTAGYSEIPAARTFEDVPTTHTFYREIQRLASRNIMQGYPCGGVGEPCVSGKPYFRPGNNVTRGQSAKIVANTFFPACQVASPYKVKSRQ